MFPLFLIIPAAYFLLFILSYFWVDLNLTLVSWGPINQVIEGLKWLGYFNRPLSSRFYLVIILLLVLIQIYLLFSRFIYKTNLRKLFLLAGGVVLIASLSYPFLSHDLFSYLFDAKIIWQYQQNPYHHPPNEFSADPWLRFMHWTHRTAPYGPVWLVYSLLPAVFSFSRFILNFYGLKLLNGLVFFVAGWFLLKITNKDKKVFAYWFFNPFLLIEFLVNGHNDLLMISLFIAALFFYRYRRNILTFLLFLASMLVKYITILAWPLLLFRRRFYPWVILFAVFGLIGFAWQIDRFQPWYFTWLYLAFPLMKMTGFSWLVVFAFQTLLLIFKYQPFLATGSWEATAYRSLFQTGLAALGMFFLTFLPIFRRLAGKLLKTSL